MNAGQTVFSQLMEFLPLPEFRRCVERYSGEYKVQSFSCLDQFLCLAFAQLTYRESLRDIEACLRAQQSKLYHMGFRSKVSRSTQVELFFRWIKQHLRIKSFYGTSENAVKIQVWVAIAIYVLVAILKKRLNLDLSLYKILQILSITLFEKTLILPALSNFSDNNQDPDISKQLQLFDL